MKTVTANPSPRAAALLVERARVVGIDAAVIPRSRLHHRRHSALGSTSAPQKVVLFDGIRMSIGQARQYLTAREKRV